MSDQAKRNGEAAAFGYGTHEHGGETGLSKREYFAAMAMQGLAQNVSVYDLGYLAKKSVEIADAVLLALENEAQS